MDTTPEIQYVALDSLRINGFPGFETENFIFVALELKQDIKAYLLTTLSSNKLLVLYIDCKSIDVK